MTKPELEKLSNIVDELWQLHQETKDIAAQGQIKSARATLLVLWNEASKTAEAN